jgi:sugar/nucleoside kinase (ribokinase family)
VPFDVLVAGEINPDLILSDPSLAVAFGQQETLVERAVLTVGSSSAIFACGAARLGLRVGFIGVVGDDLFGRFRLDALRAHGVDVSPVVVDPALQTGFSVILSRGADRAIITYPGAMAALRAGQVTDDLLGAARHLHVASYFLQTSLQPGLPDLLRRARRLGLTTSLDTNWDHAGQWQGFDALLRLVDVFLPNQNEVLAISGSPTVEAALEQLGAGCDTVAVKLGADGGVARRGSQIVRAPAVPVAVVDTVGAGDTFDVGFLYGMLNGWGLDQSLRLACACGSLSTRAAGGVDGQPSLEEAQSVMEVL